LALDNISSKIIKANDSTGNPIEVGGAIVYQVRELAQAVFAVEGNADEEGEGGDTAAGFIKIELEKELRNLVDQYPYRSDKEEQPCLLRNREKINKELKDAVQKRLEKAGIEVTEASINHLAFAPEIAGAMLKVQEAEATIQARTKIVKGAVEMCRSAVDQLEKVESDKNSVIKLTEAQKAELLINMMTVLVSDEGAKPVVSLKTKD